MSGRTGIVLCTCGDHLYSKKEAESFASRITFSEGMEVEVFIDSAACNEPFLSSLKKSIQQKGITKLLITGCHPGRIDDVRLMFAQECALAGGCIRGVAVKPLSSGEKKGPFGLDEELLTRSLHGVKREINALQLIEPISLSRIPLNQGVLVVGSGKAGTQAAEVLSRFGYEVTLTEQHEEIRETGADLERVTRLTGHKLVSFNGDIGSFTAVLEGPGGLKTLECGALILASGFGGSLDPKELLQKRFKDSRVVSLPALDGEIGRFLRIPKSRTIGIVLDIDLDETKASSETALRTALKIQRQDVYQVMLFCRDIRVGSIHLEKLYDDARESGVIIVKYEGRVSIHTSEEGAILSIQDAVLEEYVSFLCDLIGISPYGLDQADMTDVSSVTGVLPDELGRLQENNIHLLPVETNIPGIFTAGACRGTFYDSRIAEEARVAALQVHRLLSQKTLLVEHAEAKVDAEKCALCLTCIRACPHNAMHINREEGAAESSPQACQRCGICAGECPAKAITLPVYSDAVVLAQLGF